MNSKQNKSFMLRVIVVILVVIFFIFILLVPPYRDAKDKAAWSQCLESLGGIKVAEEMYFIDHKIYTTIPDLLAIDMIAGCTDPTGQSEACKEKVYNRVRNNCNHESDWEITTGETGDMQSYYIRATMGDRYKCKVCVSPDGYLPSFIGSTCPKRLPMKCPVTEKKNDKIEDDSSTEAEDSGPETEDLQPPSTGEQENK